MKTNENENKGRMGTGRRFRTPMLATEGWHRFVTVVCLCACFQFTVLGFKVLREPPTDEKVPSEAMAGDWPKADGDERLIAGPIVLVLLSGSACVFLVHQLWVSWRPRSRRRSIDPRARG